MGRTVYYGWWVVAAVFLMLMVSSGFGFYNLSVYINVLAAERGFSVSDVSVAVSLFFVVGGVTGIAVARLIESYDVRWVMLGGAALGGASLGCVGQAESLWQLYTLFLLFGAGNSAISIVTATTLVTRWFPGPNRAVALSIASTGLSAGGILVTPLSARLLAGWGLEAALPWLGLLFFLLVVPVALWVVRARPPAPPPGTVDGADGHAGWRYADAVRSRFFVLLTLGYALCLGSQVGAIAHLYNRAVQLGDFRYAAGAVQALTLMSILGRIGGGWLVTRIPIRPFTLGNLVGQGIGLAAIAAAVSPTQVILAAALFGCTVGNLLMLHPLWLADAFGGQAYARIFSLSNAVTVLGVAAGPALLGMVFDASNYRVAYLCAVCGSVLALALLTAAGAQPVMRGGPVVAGQVSGTQRG